MGKRDKQKQKPKPGHWAGEEVGHAASGEAERAAERAEGNAPATAEEVDRRRHEPLELEPEDEIRRVPSGETPDEKLAEAGEQHRAAEGDVNRQPHGKL